MSDDRNRIYSLLNKKVPDNPGRPAPYTPVAPPPAATPTSDAPERESENARPTPQQPNPAAPPSPADPMTPPSAAPSPTAAPWANLRARSAADEAAARVAGFEQVADEMRRYADGLKATLRAGAERTWDVSSDDGVITVTVDGRPRILGVRIDPRARRERPEILRSALVTVLNEAVRTSRQESSEAVLARLDPALRSAIGGLVADTERMIEEDGR